MPSHCQNQRAGLDVLDERERQRRSQAPSPEPIMYWNHDQKQGRPGTGSPTFAAQRLSHLDLSQLCHIWYRLQLMAAASRMENEWSWTWDKWIKRRPYITHRLFSKSAEVKQEKKTPATLSRKKDSQGMENLDALWNSLLKMKRGRMRAAGCHNLW